MINFIEMHRQRLADYGRKAVVSIGRLSQDDLRWRPNSESNSIANLVFHMNGNLRWRVMETMGGIPFNRDRDAEFSADGDYAKDELLRIWTEVFGDVDKVLAAMTEDRLTETVVVRDTRMTLAENLVRVTTHAGEHVGQIIYIAKMKLGTEFETLSIPLKRKS